VGRKRIPITFFQENVELLLNGLPKEISATLNIPIYSAISYRQKAKLLFKTGKINVPTATADSPTFTLKKRVKYLSNQNLLIELEKSRQQGQITEELGKMFILLVDNISHKPNFSGYSYLNTMKSHALEMLCNKWDKFDVEYATANNTQVNPFAYYTTIVINSFIAILNEEKKHQNLRDDVLEIYGMQASLSRQMESDNYSYDSHTGD